MKIKSLLLGSAAAMAAATTAQAADAIVVEPEPVEYVRVCDMYGAGYFYIPGTETCLKLGGYVQLDYWSDNGHDNEYDDVSDHRVRSRARLNVVAKNETEYGTLHSEIRWFSDIRDGNVDHDTFSTTDSRGYGGNGLSSMGVWLATMSLAGFRAGYDATNYTIFNTYGGYGFYNAVQSGGYTEASGFLFEYNGSFGDVNYGIGIVDTAYSGAAGQPDVMAGLSFNLGDLAVGTAMVYDSNSEGISYRVRGDYDLASLIGSPMSIGGWWEADNGETDYTKGHQWGVTARWRMGNFTLFGGYSEHDYDCDYGAWKNANGGEFDGNISSLNGNASVTGNCAAQEFASAYGYDTDSDGSDQWTVGVRWDVTPDLFVQLEHNKTQSTSYALNPVVDAAGDVTAATVSKSDIDRGRTWLRIRRSF